MLSQFLRKGRKGDGTYMAAQSAQAPLNDHMMLLMAQELPMLDSVDRTRVYAILDSYTGPTICSQEELPAEIREIMEL